MCFSLYLGIWRGGEGGGVSQGIGTQPSCAVFHRWELKNRSFRNFFFDIATTQYDHPRYVKHVSARNHVFFTLFAIGCGGDGGGPTGLVHNPLMQFFSPYSSKIEVFEIIFLIL